MGDQALAERLGLSNVTFVQGDALNYREQREFSVVTSVASLTEVEGHGPEPTHPFSAFQSGQEAWNTSHSALAQAAERLLRPGGIFVSMERLQDFGEFARWFGAVQRAGLSVNFASTRMVRWSSPPAGAEAMPVLIAAKEVAPVPATFEDLVTWYRDRGLTGHDDFLVELELLEAPHLSMVAGKHFDVSDDHGSGQTRVYVLDLGSDAVLYMTTSRGMRGFLREAGSADDLIPELDALLVELSAAPEVIGMRDLTAADFAEELRR
ncbi:MAG: hypothetical protein ACKOA9_00250 [Actinomycetota bacterium]